MIYIKNFRFIAILVSTLTFILTGCRIEGTIDFQADGNAKVSFEVEDSDGKMGKIKRTCESVKILVKAHASFIKNPKIEDITPSGGNLTCRVSSDEALQGFLKINGDRDSYSVEVPKSGGDTDFNEFKVKLTISMPTKVTKSTLGKIEGNKVIINDPNFFNKGISIEARNGRAAEGSSKGSSSTVRGGLSSSHDEGGFPWWGWAGIGAGLVAAMGGAGIVAGRRKRAAAATGYPPNGMAAGHRPGDVQNMAGPDMSGTYGTLHSPSHNGYGQQTTPGPTHDLHEAPPAGKQFGDPHDQFRPR